MAAVIVHVITNLHAASGGPTTAVIELAREQAGRGEPVRIIVDRLPADAAGSLDALQDRWRGRDVRFAPSVPLAGAGAVRRGSLVEDFRHLNPRIVHLHGVWDRVLRTASSACSELRIPWVVSTHGMLHPWALSRGWLKKRLYLALFPELLGNARTIVTLNAEEAAWVRRHVGTSAVAVPNGLELSPYVRPADGSFARSVPGLDGRAFVLFLGRLDPIKGVDRLLASYALAVERGLRAHLVIAGPDFGAERGLRRQSAGLGLLERVHFVGPLAGDRKLQALAECALYAHQPRYEGFGISIAEALAAGRPVVTTTSCRIDGAAEAGALRICADDPPEFGRAMAEILADPEAGLRLGIRGREWVRGSLAWASVLPRVEAAYAGTRS